MAEDDRPAIDPAALRAAVALVGAGLAGGLPGLERPAWRRRPGR